MKVAEEVKCELLEIEAVTNQNPVPLFHRRDLGRQQLDGHRAGTVDHHGHERRRLPREITEGATMRNISCALKSCDA